MRIRRALLSGATALTAALALLGAGPSAEAAVRPPRPLLAAATTGPVCWFGACYDYVSGRQITDASGASVRMMQAMPMLKPGNTDSHSLQELALQSTDRKSTVEIGWTVDLGLNGDPLPHLFVYHWVDGQESCYNGCGFVQVSRTVRPGMVLLPGTAGRFGIENRSGDWWVLYDGEAVGYFPGSLWQGRYTRAQVITAFGEVAHATGSTCEEMGDGLPGTGPGASWIRDFRLIGSTDSPALKTTATSPDLYDAGHTTPTSFWLGGPGSGPC